MFRKLYLLVTLVMFTLPACEWDFEYELDNIPSAKCYTTDKPTLWVLIHPFADGVVEYWCVDWNADTKQWENITIDSLPVKARKVAILRQLDADAIHTNTRCAVKATEATVGYSHLVWTVDDLGGQGL